MEAKRIRIDLVRRGTWVVDVAVRFWVGGVLENRVEVEVTKAHCWSSAGGDVRVEVGLSR